MGRPRTGIMRFNDQTLAALPVSGSIRAFAEALGVTSTTISDWVSQEGAPISVNGMAKTLYRDDFVPWLKKTGRYRKDPVLDYTEQVKQLGPEAQEFIQRWSNAVSLSAVFVAEFLKVLEAERARF